MVSAARTSELQPVTRLRDAAVIAHRIVPGVNTINAEVDVYDSKGDAQMTEVPLGTSSAVVDDPANTVTPTNTGVVNFNEAKSTVGTAIGTAPTTTNTVGAEQVQATTSATPAVVPNDNPPLPGGDNCDSYTFVSTYAQRSETFYNLYAYGNAEVDENVGSGHKIAVGLKYSNDVTGWSEGASVELGQKSASRADISYGGNHQITNSVNVGYYKANCFPYHAAEFQAYKTQSTGFAFLQTTANTINPRSWTPANCNLVFYTPGHAKVFGKSSGSDQTFKAGLDGPFISLSVEASYSKESSVSWTIPAKNEELCGSNSGFASAAFGGGQKEPTTGGGCGATDTSSITDGGAAVLTPADNPGPIC